MSFSPFLFLEERIRGFIQTSFYFFFIFQREGDSKFRTLETLVDISKNTDLFTRTIEIFVKNIKKYKLIYKTFDNLNET